MWTQSSTGILFGNRNAGQRAFFLFCGAAGGGKVLEVRGCDSDAGLDEFGDVDLRERGGDGLWRSGGVWDLPGGICGASDSCAVGCLF